jgi:SAM-dependent methyltransferase
MDRPFPEIVREALDDGTFVSLVLSRPCSGCAVPERQTVRPVKLRGGTQFQWSLRAGTQERHENLTAADSARRASDLFPSAYRNARLLTATAEVNARVTKRGDVQTSHRPAAPNAPAVGHNRERRYLIPDGVPCPFLAAIGVMTSDGRVRAQQQHKFRQINRYLEFVEDVVPHLPSEGPLEVVDFGCGKSGLTFALHHLLTAVHGRDIHVVGLDRNASVLANCREIAERLHLRGLEFREGDIASYATGGPVHLAVSLHACDTATDDALAQAVRWKCDVILAVPCCQHELSPQLESAALDLLLRHGILRERFAADATDALRAARLELEGYRTQVLEFIELEHTPKNLLLRAVRLESPSPPERHTHSAAAYATLKPSLGIHHFHLDRLLGAVESESDEPPGTSGKEVMNP